MNLYFSYPVAHLLKLFPFPLFIDENRNFSYLCKVDLADHADALVYAENTKYFNIAASNENISAIITTIEVLKSLGIDQLPLKSLLICSTPKYAYLTINEKLFHDGSYYNEFLTAIGKNTKIEPTSIISKKNVVIGENCYIGHNTVILPHTYIGDNTSINENCVIGGEGYDIYGELGTISKHYGYLKIGGNVEIQALCHISKSLTPNRPTIIGDYTKIASSTNIQHGVQCGECCKIASGVMISGYVTIGGHCWIGPLATISNNIKIGDAAQVLIGSVVTKNVPSCGRVSGNFAIDHKNHLEHIKQIR